MAAGRNKQRSEKFFITGGPVLVRCKNTTYTEGIVIHMFPKEEVKENISESFGDTGQTAKRPMHPC